MSNYKSNLQSNNETLSANNLDLQSLIEQANALPDAGGGESSSIDTCTVIVEYSSYPIKCIHYTKVENGKIKTITLGGGYSNTSVGAITTTLENVLCGSAFSITYIGGASIGMASTIKITNGTVLVSSLNAVATSYPTGYFIAPITPGVISTITV